MSWEVSNLIMNDDSGITIVDSGGHTLTNVKPSIIYTQYQTDSQSYSSMNPNANTILLGKGNSSVGYTYTHGLTLPTDKTIYIQTDQNDGNVWFRWDGISNSSDFGSDCWSTRSFNFGQYYTYGFNYGGTGYNFYPGATGKTINNKQYYGQTWLGSSAQFLPLIWTTIPLSNFVINGERYDSNAGGGAGSGYIGNLLLSNKKMVGYNVPTSSAESTKTESVNEASETPVANKPKIGNGFARIKFLRALTPNPPDEYLSDIDAINGSGYFVKSGGGSGWEQPCELSYPISTNSYYSTKSHTFVPYSYFNANDFYALYDGCYLCLADIYTVYITSNNGVYSYSLTPSFKKDVYSPYDGTYNYWGQSYELKAPYYNNKNIILGYSEGSTPSGALFTTHSYSNSNLHSVFADLKNHARNVNIFVDGECWSLASKQ